MVEIAQTDGVLVAAPIVGGGQRVELGSGSVKSDDGSGLKVGSDRIVDPDDHYAVDLDRRVTVAGRSADQVTLRSPTGFVRARLSFDDASGVLVRSTVLNADGSIWCDMRLADLEQVAGAVEDTSGPATGLDAVEPPDDPRLPESAGGIDRIDVYRWKGRGTVGYYSDGLLSFTILASPDPLKLTAPDAVALDVDDGTVIRWYGPGSVALSWESESGGIAVFGDVPLDVQDQIRSDLPEPRASGVLRRLWRNFFD